jgi:hypothetical protein
MPRAADKREVASAEAKCPVLVYVILLQLLYGCENVMANGPLKLLGGCQP